MTDLVDPHSETVDSTASSLAATRAALRPGDTAGRYKILAFLGEGGMGRVYRAHDPELDREVAIKVLKRTCDPALEQRLKREAQAMARLAHPNLITVYDVGHLDGEVFMAMELVDGVTLADWARDPSHTLADRLRVLVAAGHGLVAAHAAGVVHRDFKPDNVIVTRSGAAKVLDFGLARHVDAPSEQRALPSATNLTSTGALIGTPAYMSPEQYRGDPVDARADQFAFAVSAWEVLFGEKPFRGQTLVEMADAICFHRIAAPPADAPPAIVATLRRATDPDREKRFPDLATLVEMLEPRRRPIGMWIAGAISIVAIATAVVVVVMRNDKPELPGWEGKLTREELKATVKRYRPQQDACYAPHAKVVGKGRISIEFVIDGTGAVISTRILEDSFDGAGGIARCVAKVSLDWQFPAPRGGGRVRVVYPFSLSPD